VTLVSPAIPPLQLRDRLVQLFRISKDGYFKRWFVDNNNVNKNPRLQLVGTFNGFTGHLFRGYAVERDDDGAIVVLVGLTLKVWNTTTFECTDSVPA